MEMYIALLCVVFALGSAQDLTADFADSSPRYVSVGAKNVKLTCTINRDLLYMVQNNIQIFRKPALGDGEEVILTQAGQRVGAEPAYYNVDLQPVDGKLEIAFEIIEVRDIDDGQLICRASPGQGEAGETAESSVEIIVVRPIESLHLKFDNSLPIGETTATPVAIDSGSYKVQCIVNGSNPATEDVHVFLHGNKLPHSNPVSIQIEGSAVRMYRTTIEADVNLMVENSGQEVECSATGRAGETKMVKLPIKINVYEPTINCTDTKSYTGKMYPELTCTVDHTGLNVKGYKYQLGKTGEIVEEGQQNEDFVEVHTERISPTVMEVQLKLYEAKDWHFESDFYVLVELDDGHISRQSVKLIKSPGSESDNGEDQDPNNSCGVLKMSLATLFLSLMCFWLQNH